jgi:hypothetical protein
MKLLITGSRHGHPDLERWIARWLLARGKPEVFVLGDAEGVDADALHLCRLNRLHCTRVLVNLAIESPRRFLERNERMVAECGPGDVCMAFPRADSRGTYHCANLARKAGLTVYTAEVP